MEEASRHAVVNDENVIVNIIIAQSDFDPGEGFTLVSIPEDSPLDIGNQLE